MKRFFMALMAVAALASATAQGPGPKVEKPWKYVDAQELRVINKGFDDTDGPYTRIPKALKDSVRPTLWDRTQCSSGIGVRFATNSSRVGVRYNLLWNTHMIHMADTGQKVPTSTSWKATAYGVTSTLTVLIWPTKIPKWWKAHTLKTATPP